MKSLAFFALSAIATAAMATQPVSTPTLKISGTSVQVASVNGGNVTNTAKDYAYANQNIASNKGGVEIKGTSSQTAILTQANVTNDARSAGDVAVQSLASNVGDVTVDKSYWLTGNSTQTVYVTNGSMTNEADSGAGCYGSNCRDAALAYQNAASNMGDISISGTSIQAVGVSGYGTRVSNEADGKSTAAIQNLSSNYGKVSITGYSNQSTSILNGAQVANLARGTHAVAIQNIASNDSCDPPPAVCVGPACGPFALAH